MKLNYKRTILVGFAFFLISAFWSSYDSIVPLILTNKFDMKQTFSGAIMSLDNVFAVILLPIFGAISDKTRSRFGKRTPFIVVGTVLAAIFNAFLGIMPSVISFILMLLACLLAMAIFRSPAVALMPDVTVKPLRSKGNAIINLMGTAGGMLALGISILFNTDEPGKTDFTTYLITISAVMVVALVVYLLTVKECKWAEEMVEESKSIGFADNISEDEEKNGPGLSASELKSLILILASVALWYIGYNAVTSKYSVYATEILNVPYNVTLLIAQGAAIVSFIPVGMIASKIGRRKSILIGVGILGSSFLIASFVTAGTPTAVMYVIFATAGIGWATINVNSFPMVVELAKRGDVGKYTGFYYTASMAAQIVTPILSGFLVDQLGWEIFFPYAALFVALSFVTMFFVQHGDSHPDQKGLLESLDVDD